MAPIRRQTSEVALLHEFTSQVVSLAQRGQTPRRLERGVASVGLLDFVADELREARSDDVLDGYRPANGV